jgi:hypothetical protein
VSCTPGYLGTTYNENFRVWIDYNIDGDFEDDGELVFDPAPTTIEVNGSFTVPASITPGVSRLRVSMAYTPINANNEPSSCGNLVYGEIEDYCITLSTTVGVQEQSSSIFQPWPNPASSWLQFSPDNFKPLHLEIMSVDGRTTFTISTNGWPRVALPELCNGSYLLRAVDEQGSHVWPLIIVH